MMSPAEPGRMSPVELREGLSRSLFFVAFNIPEASLHSLVSGWCPGGIPFFASVFVFGIAVVALWLEVASGMRIGDGSAERSFPVRVGADAVALREELVRLRGGREVVVPEEGIARLTVYPESLDERAATEIIGGEG